MVNEATLIQYDAEQRIADNEAGFGFLAEMSAKMAQMEAKIEKIPQMEAKIRELKSEFRKSESLRQRHLDLRQRAICVWVRDALGKRSELLMQDIRRLNYLEDVIDGDVRSDAIMLTERYEKSSIEWQSFSILYGLTPDDVNSLDQEKCCGSLQALDRAASILLENAWTSLPTEAMAKEREDLVALLLEKKYDEAEKMSSTILWGDESSEAEQ